MLNHDVPTERRPRIATGGPSLHLYPRGGSTISGSVHTPSKRVRVSMRSTPRRVHPFPIFVFALCDCGNPGWVSFWSPIFYRLIVVEQSPITPPGFFVYRGSGGLLYWSSEPDAAINRFRLVGSPVEPSSDLNTSRDDKLCRYSRPTPPRPPPAPIYPKRFRRSHTARLCVWISKQISGVAVYATALRTG